MHRVLEHPDRNERAHSGPIGVGTRFRAETVSMPKRGVDGSACASRLERQDFDGQSIQAMPTIRATLTARMKTYQGLK